MPRTVRLVQLPDTSMSTDPGDRPVPKDAFRVATVIAAVAAVAAGMSFYLSHSHTAAPTPEPAPSTATSPTTSWPVAISDFAVSSRGPAQSARIWTSNGP
jgi:hypothetical protein